MTDEVEKERLLSKLRPDPFDGICGFFGEYRWLSNFHEASLLYNGTLWPSVEHAYQASKAKYAIANELHAACVADEIINNCDKPKDAMRLGRQIIVGEKWHAIKRTIMFQCVLAKFLANIRLREQLLETNELYIEETNWWNDRYWGVYRSEGENQLGKILMEVRTLLK